MFKINLRRSFIFHFILVLALGFFQLFFPTLQVSAHANLVRSDPERGAILPVAPKVITMEFSEALDPQLSQIQLLDSRGQVLVKAPGRVDPSNAKVMQLDLPPLPAGAFTAVWQTHSAADGHFANGTVGFSVGKFDPAISFLPAENVVLPTEAIPTVPDVLTRWLGYLAAALMAGGISFGSLVWRPAFRHTSQPDLGDDRTAGRVLKRQVLIGAGLLILATLLGLAYQVFVGVSNSGSASFSGEFIRLISASSSWPFWVRLIGLVILIPFLLAMSDPGRGYPADWLALMPLAGIILATFSLKSHAASINNPLAILLDTFHLAAMSVWFGGLLPLFLLLRRTKLPPAVLVPYFSRAALVSVALLGLTGLYSAYLQVRTLDALTASSYGLILLVKTGLFGLLIGLGALNLLILTPRFQTRSLRTSGQIRVSMRIEMILGTLLLVAVGMLTATAPSYEAVQADRQIGIVGDVRQDGVQIRLWLAPDSTGVSEVAVDLSGLPAGWNSSTSQVLFRFHLVDRDLGVTQAVASPVDQKRYRVVGSYFTLAGNWVIEVILRQPGSNDIRSSFPVYIQTASGDPNPANPIPADDRSLAAGKVLYQAYCQACHGETGMGDGPAGRVLTPPPANLQMHTFPGVHTDGQLFYWITHGLSGTAMPDFSAALTEPQRWGLVNFIRTFADLKK